MRHFDVYAEGEIEEALWKQKRRQEINKQNP